MTTFVSTDTKAAEQAAAEAEARGAKRVKLDSLKNTDFAKSKSKPLGRATRILPAVAGMTLPWVTIKKHEFRDPYTEDSRIMTSWPCPKEHGGGRCLSCEVEEASRGSDKDLSYMLRTKDRYMALVIDIENDAPVIRKFEFGSTVQKRLLSFINDHKLDFSSLEHGIPLNIAFDKKQPGALMWTVEVPIGAKAAPFSPEMIEAIKEAYPEGGMDGMLFTPNPEWQAKELTTGKAQSLNGIWARYGIGDAGNAAVAGSAHGSDSDYGRSSGSSRDHLVDPSSDEDIPF